MLALRDPGMNMDLLITSASNILSQLHQRKLSAVELLDIVEQRIDRVNPVLNAIVAMDRKAARTAAQEADRRIASGEARPLEGLVMTVKDSLDVAGLVSTAGAPVYRDRVPETDAVTVARLRQAGAIVLGKTNVPAFTGDFQTFNAVYGTTNNPWDVGRSPGGSSGGAAAAVATGMAVLELGSDFGGSIRWPAHACGVFGHRPTWGLVSTRGHVPPPPGATMEAEFATVGPLARSARDLALVLELILGPATADKPHTPLATARASSPKGLRVALWADDASAPVDASVRDAVVQAGRLLSAAGADVDDTARPDFSFDEQFEVFGLFNHAIVASGLPAEVREKIAAKAASFAPDDRSHQALQARGAKLDAQRWAEMQAKRARYRAAWAAFFEQYDVVLCPPAPVPAIPHDHTSSFHARSLDVNGARRPYFDFLVWSSLATLSNLPATVAPVGRTGDGLPVGVQIIAPEAADRTAIAVAEMLENLGCRYAPPPLAMQP